MVALKDVTPFGVCVPSNIYNKTKRPSPMISFKGEMK